MSKHEHGHQHAHGHLHEPGHKNEHDCGKCYRCSKLSPLSLALSAGIVFGLGTMLLGWSAATYHWGLAMVQVVSSVYKGFAPTLTGGLWGGVWGFFDGFISGLVFAWIYNGCLCCSVCKYKK